METMVTVLAALLIECVQDILENEDPWQIQIPTGLPDEAQTIGQAAQHYADFIGYQLACGYPETSESDRIATRAIAKRNWQGCSMPVNEAILALIDDSCDIVADYECKVFAFKKIPIGKH